MAKVEDIQITQKQVTRVFLIEVLAESQGNLDFTKPDPTTYELKFAVHKEVMKADPDTGEVLATDRSAQPIIKSVADIPTNLLPALEQFKALILQWADAEPV